MHSSYILALIMQNDNFMRTENINVIYTYRRGWTNLYYPNSRKIIARANRAV